MHDEDVIRRAFQPTRPQQVGLQFLSQLRFARAGSIVEVLLPANQSAVVVSAPGMLRAIVGIEIEIKRIEGKAKLSQNRETRDRLNAADTLSAKGHDDLGRAMREAQ